MQEIISGVAEHPSIPFVHDSGNEIANSIHKMV